MKSTTTRLRLECLESRDLLSADWFSTYIPNAAIANLARADWYGHGSVNYNDMLAIYAQVEKSGPVSSSEFASLQFLGTYGSLLNTPSSVLYLENQVVGHNPADLSYQGYGLGYLGTNSPSWQMQELVGKWFLGQDHPAAPGQTYRPVSGSLFGAYGPQYTDVAQGGVGDCSLIASFAETAYKDAGVISSMFTYDGNNVWTVGFYENGASVYVTVDNQLPGGGGTYDHPQNGVLWVALAEKAYAELNAFDNQDGVAASLQGKNAYSSLNGMDPAKILPTLTDRAGYSAYNPTTINQALAQGFLIVLGTGSNSGNPNVVGDHAYAVLGYNASTHMYTMFNPWGIQQAAANHVWGLWYANQAYLDLYFTDEGGYVRATPANEAASNVLLTEATTHTALAIPVSVNRPALADAVFAAPALPTTLAPSHTLDVVVAGLSHQAPTDDALSELAFA